MPPEREHQSPAKANAAKPEAAARRPATGWLALQQRAGNRVTRALARSAEAGTPPPVRPRVRVTSEAPMHILHRAWVATEKDKEEEWDGDTPGKKWKRRAASSGYEYWYTVTSGTMDTEYEMEWHPADWYAQQGLTIPPALLASAPSEESSSDDDEYEEQWKVEALFGAIKQKGLAGVCNALTASYLLGLIDPDAGTTGMTTQIFEKTALLKSLLDDIVTYYSDYDSSDVTYGFIQWGKAKNLTGDWLARLTSSNLAANTRSFREFFEEQRGTMETPGGVTISGLYNTLSLGGIYGKVEDMLEPWFSMTASFQGVLVIKATKQGTNAANGHEMAIRYSSKDYTFEIFDQNTGLERITIREQEDIAEAIAGHLMLYVKKPMPVIVRDEAVPSDGARFEVQIHP